jgi:hypothetical protein
MNTFKKKSLHAAVLAGLGALGAAGTADAVHLNPDGTGQVLVYPYYTVRSATAGAYNTAMSIVNSTNQTKLVKVRFLEGRNSREVLDFNLFLSPSDVWAGVIVPTAAGARVITNDNSCVAPSDLFTRAGNLNDFKNFEYANVNGRDFSDSGPQGLDRTREGYMEVIEMGVITDATVTGFVKHGSSGVPNNCPALDRYDPQSGNTTNIFPGTFLAPPSGGLFGRGYVIAAETGANYTYDATAFDAWSSVVNYTSTGFVTPRLGDAFPPVSNVFVGAGANSTNTTGNVNATWALGVDAFSATIMRDTVLNEFILDAGTASKTDWVLTFPTKRQYVSVGTGPAVPPFFNNFNFPFGSCDPYTVGIYNREEGTIGASPNVILPSPRPPTSAVPGSSVCWESTVVPFSSGGSLLGSSNTSALAPAVGTFVNGATTTAGPATSAPGAQGPNGWMLMAFSNTTVQLITPLTASVNGTAVAPAAARHFGLPVIGLAFTNFNRTGVVSQYGLASQAKYTRNIR